MRPSLDAQLSGLQEDALFTYYVSPAEDLPHELRDLETRVRRFLEACRRAAPDRLSYRVIHPEEHPELTDHFARIGVAPFRVRRVEHDGYVEQPVYSQLTLDLGTSATRHLTRLGREHVDQLQALVEARLGQAGEPRRPVVALSAPEGFSELRGFLLGRAQVVDWNFEQERALPEDADVFLWIEPEACDEEHVAAVEAFCARGRSVVVAGSPFEVRQSVGADPRARIERRDWPAARLLEHYGLHPVDELCLDVGTGRVGTSAGPQDLAPYLVRNIAPNQDFRGMRGQPNGSLLFGTPQVCAPDGARIAELGYRLERLATTSQRATLRARPAGEVSLAELQEHPGRPAGKQPLLVHLLPAGGERVFEGSLVFSASATPFADGLLGSDAMAHRQLVSILLATLASPERLALHRAGIERPQQVAELPPAARGGWRVATVLAPALVFVLLAALWALRTRGAGGARDRSALVRGALAAAGVLGLGFATALLPDAGIDLSAGGVARLSPETAPLLERAGLDERPVTVELLTSPRAALPPELRPRLDALDRALGQLAARFDTLTVRKVRTDRLDPAALAELGLSGIEPVAVSSELDERVELRRVYLHARLRTEDRSRRVERVLAFTNRDEALELRLVLGLLRLLTDRDLHVALASDLPRLSPAEEQLEFKRLGLFAPSEGDVYRLAREHLAAHDFVVHWVDPRAPELPDEVDVLVWMQPRREVGPMASALAAHLARGGKALVAAQHYEILSRQLSTSGLQHRFWPRPLFPDLARHYFPALSLELVPEVLLDAHHASLWLKTRIDGEGSTRFEEQLSAQPFCIRATRFAPDSPITRGLGDQLFLNGNRWRTDAQVLADLGLEAQPLVFTSERAWSYAWEGGDLPPQALEDPRARGEGDREAEDDADGRVRALTGPQALALQVRGRFPRYDALEDGGYEVSPASPDQPPGELLLVGSSQLFRDRQWMRAEYRPGDLLLNAVTALAVGPDAARVAGHRRRAPGTGYVAPERRLQLRGLAIGAAPLAFLLLAGAWRAARRRRGSAGGRA